MNAHGGTLKCMTEEPTELSAANARQNLADILNAASARGRITYITSRGRRVAAVVPLQIAEEAERLRLGGKDGLTPP